MKAFQEIKKIAEKMPGYSQAVVDNIIRQSAYKIDVDAFIKLVDYYQKLSIAELEQIEKEKTLCDNQVSV